MDIGKRSSWEKSEEVSNGFKSDVKICIETRIEADSESKARQYAASNNVDLCYAKWHPNHDKGGRLYASTTIFSSIPEFSINEERSK